MDDAGRTIDRGEFAEVARTLLLLLGYVERKLNDLIRFAVGIQDRAVRRLQPNLATAFGDACELPGQMPSSLEVEPKLDVLGALRVRRVNERAVVLAPDLIERISHDAQKVFIRAPDRTVDAEFDNRVRLVDGLGLRPEVGIEPFLGCGA